GTTVRGTIAGLMLRQGQAEGRDFSQEADCDFKTLFIDNQAIFQNAYPALTEDLKICSTIRVMPSTALSSKNKSGFKPKKNGVFDTLIDRFCADAYGRIYDPNCPTDGDRVDAFKGLYSVDDRQYQIHSATTRLLTRVGINRRRATAEDQVLYSVQVLNEMKQHQDDEVNTVFVGNIWVCDALAESLRDYLAGQGGQCRLGGSASRGLGKVKLKPESIELPCTIKHRIITFNKTLKTRWKRWQIFGDIPTESIEDRYFFTLDLQSDAILTENWQRTMVISESMLMQAVGLKEGDLRLHQAYSSYGQRSGWNTAWGLPKDNQLMTTSGSVFLFSIDAADREAWLPKLAALEIWGIGSATAEGFGQVRVCDEFHNVLREDAK
ncbi:MAG: CRISPR-associated RAMP protein Csx10, partial [Synechococcales bacterium]|nr:CRISPR-associated RAMP protein Csx10 [Synechococcales bacterium]